MIANNVTKLNFACTTIKEMVRLTKKIKVGDLSAHDCYVDLLNQLVKLELDRTEILLIQNKLSSVKGLLPMLENPEENTILFPILDYLKQLL